MTFASVGPKDIFSKTLKNTLSVLDVYPPKIDRMIIWSIPGDSSHQGASLEARFAHDSLSKTYSFSWNTEFCFSDVLDVYPPKIDRFWVLFAPFVRSRPCASFLLFNLFPHHLKNNIFKKNTKTKTLPGPSGTPDTYILRLGTISNSFSIHF